MAIRKTGSAATGEITGVEHGTEDRLIKEASAAGWSDADEAALLEEDADSE